MHLLHMHRFCYLKNVLRLTMNVTELIGFLASLLAMLFFMGKQIYESHSKNRKSKSDDSNRSRSEREERLRKFLGSLSDDMKEATSLPSSDRNRHHSIEKEDDEEDVDYDEENYEDEEVEETPEVEEEKQLMIARELHRSEIKAFQQKHQNPTRTTSQDKPYLDSSKRRLLSDDFTYHANLDKFKQQTNIESRRLNTSIENRYDGKMNGDNLVSEELRVAQSDHSAQHAYDIVSRHEISKAKRILRNLSSPRDMVICAEIFGKPKAFE